MGVQPTEAAEREDHRSKLLGAVADIGPVPSVDQLPEPLILRCLVPQLAHAGSHVQRPCVHMLQHLKQQILI
ncbi:hypothetical protein SLE2022_116720 [Rubroshorea leprosula]